MEWHYGIRTENILLIIQLARKLAYKKKRNITMKRC
uniref:Uncharacterized protein n=1 Tax=Vitis vinifera TaxID=29760 RepID=F6HPE3_VITVI